MNEQWEVIIREDGPTFYKNIWIVQKTYDGILVLGAGNETTKYTAGTSDIPPTFKLTPEMLDAFVNALFTNGIRPTKESKTEGKLEATERHLQDLRKLLKL
jgi:hypothetical protein